jgi:cysteinyl-tRNA synthetase
VVRTLLLDRRYGIPWDYTDAALDAAGQRLDALRSAAGKAHGLASGPQAVLEALVDDLDVPRAMDIAIEDGGQAARDLAAVLAL